MTILYVCGIAPDWPHPLRPLPPLDSGAPHGNIFRLVERLTQAHRARLRLVCVSALERPQRDRIRGLWPEQIGRGVYDWVEIPRLIRRWSAWLGSLPLTQGALRRIFGADTLKDICYLRGIERRYRELSPDLVLLDDSPQLLPGLSRFVPTDKMVFQCRADMSSSRRYLHLPASIFVTCPPLAEWVRSINPRAPSCRLVRNSLPPEILSEPWRPERFSSTPKTILFAGRIVEVKGVEQLLRAYAKLRTRFPDSRLEILGAPAPNTPAPSGYEIRMRRLAADLLPTEAVRWRGWLSGDALHEAYRGAYMAVFPSTYIEGFGMVALEAMAFGLPVVASRRPGFESTLDQGAGILVDDPRDVDVLASAISRLLGDPALAESMGRRGHQQARLYTAARSAEDFLAAVDSVREREA